MQTETIAPSGWGYLPGWPIAHCTGDNLPALPLLRMVRGAKARCECIAEAAEQAGIDPRTITPEHVRDRYGIVWQESIHIVVRLQRGVNTRRGDRDDQAVQAMRQ